MAWRWAERRRSIAGNAAPPSLLASGLPERLGAVALVLILLWLAVAWALLPVGAR